MFIIITENNRNERKIAENLSGCTYKITYISAAFYPLQLNLVLGTKLMLRNGTFS